MEGKEGNLMTDQCERLTNVLFSNPEREHIDVKFFVTGGIVVSRQQFCQSGAHMLEQMHAGVGADEGFEETFTQTEAKDFIANC